MSAQPPPEGFLIGHWTDPVGVTGCTAVIAPAGARGGVDVRGGGPGTRETEVIGPLAGTAEVTAVMLTGGSAFGLGAADGVMRWCEERGRGYATPGGLVPIVPAAVIYDLAAGDPAARPDADAGYAACEAAAPGVPERGRVGAGTGAAVGKIGGRESATPAGIGYAAERTGLGHVVAAIAVVNAFGDVIGAGRRGAGRRPRRRRRAGEIDRGHDRRDGVAAGLAPARGAQHDAGLRAHRRAARQAGVLAGRADGESPGSPARSTRCSPTSTATSPSASHRARRRSRIASPRSPSAQSRRP